MFRSFAILLSLTLLFPCSCRRETEEDRIRTIVAEVEQAAERKDVRTILNHLARTYRDPQGNDYEGIRGLLGFSFFRHPRVSVFIPAMDVTLSEGAARAQFQAVLTGGEQGGSPGALLPRNLGVYDFDVSFSKMDGEWKIVSAGWTQEPPAPQP